jgi:hypothetical protein
MDMDPFFQKNGDFQHSILYGALLGDAYLYPRKGIIQLEQCVEHGEYLFWLFENLKSYTTGKSPSLVKRLDKRNGKSTHSYRFYTRALFHHWRPYFYHENGVKKLPENFEECLDSTALAVWFLDDGGRSSGVQTGVFLTVDNYTQNEIEIIQHTLINGFHIHTRCHRSGKSKSGTIQKRLSITGDNYKRFVDTVSPLILQMIEKSIFQNSMARKKLKGV